MRPTLLSTLILVFPFTLIGANATAQEGPRRIESSGGYQALYLWAGDGDNNVTLPKGWYADTSVRLSRLFAGVVHVGVNYKTNHIRFSNEGLVVEATIHLKLLQLASGIRVNGAANRVRPFGQVLVGALRLSGEGSATGTMGNESFTVSTDAESEFEPMMQAGGGVNVRVTPRLGIRAGADYVYVFGDLIGLDAGINGIRAGVGAVVGF